MIGPMSPLSHVGHKVSALLDGQLSPSETDRAWAHVHVCPPCRDLVEREGRLKRTLAQLGQGAAGSAPDSLKGALVSGIAGLGRETGPPLPAYLDPAAHSKQGLRLAGRSMPSAGGVAMAGATLAGVAFAGVAFAGVAVFGLPTAWVGQPHPPVASFTPTASMAPVAQLPADRTEPHRKAQQVRPGHHFSRAEPVALTLGARR